ncbi:response regulator [Larkinella arboricola]
MNSRLQLFNWSLRKALETIPDELERVKVKVFFYLMIINLVRNLAITYYNVTHEPYELFLDDVRYTLEYLLLIKIILARPNYLKYLVHVLQIGSLYVLYLTIYVDHQLNTVLVVQYLIIAIIFSFYGLGRVWGTVYSVLHAGLAIAYHIRPISPATFAPADDDYSSPVYILIVSINFLIIIASHYYYPAVVQKMIDDKNSLNLQLEKASKAKSDFLQTMSHELRTPLNIVMGITYLLNDSKLNEEQKENLNLLRFSAESLLLLINDILDFNRFESKNVELESVPFSISYLLDNVCDGFSIKAKEKGITCRLEIAPQIRDQYVYGDPTRFVQIMFNLVGNAIKFTQEGGVEVSASVVRQADDQIRIRFSVKDTGIGIRPDQQTIIFDPFIQASASIQREFGGTGLGLAIVKHLLTLHQSTIHLESQENKGTHFYFEIDYKTVSLQDNSFHSPGIASSYRDLSQLKVLLAEDNPHNVSFMKKVFQTWNNTISVAENGKEVLEKLDKDKYDVILMDIQMPLLNGYETAQLIRQLNDFEKSNTPIIALTAYVATDVIKRIKEVGMNDYLLKPFKSDELRHKLSQLVINRGFGD